MMQVVDRSIMSKEFLSARHLRPYLFSGYKRSQCSLPTRYFSATNLKRGESKRSSVNSKDYHQRVTHLQAQISLQDFYPQLPQSIARNRLQDAEELSQACSGLEVGETDADQIVAIVGTRRW